MNRKQFFAKLFGGFAAVAAALSAKPKSQAQEQWDTICRCVLSPKLKLATLPPDKFVIPILFKRKLCQTTNF
jgi:hypothetical protein